ncbi:MAG: hypothetical protein IPI43_18455 [Sandaracinaceae bacterium]|jgi:DNA-binding CsgD family transcriptional regulator|nr:hypothetical protein [Sandaracinaceae bacterium]
MEVNAMQSNQLIEVTEQLTQLDPVRTYPHRAGETLAGLVRATGFRVERVDGETVTSEPAPRGEPSLSLPLRNGREVIGTLHLYGHGAFGEEEVRLTRWGARMIARGIAYCARLTSEGGRRSGEAVEATLKRAPLTPRERDVVSLLVAGSSTRDIASRTGLTVSTVNTYLKRIFSKLGVHSRVELVARMAGTDGLGSTDGRVAYDDDGDLAQA